MTEPGLTLEEILERQARDTANEPPEPIPDAAGLPADVRDGHVDDKED